MREILFRGKKNNSGEWVYGNLFNPDKADTPTQICMGTHIVRICYEIDPKTVGQYTGLTDKNGKKIFEGDIVKYSTNKVGIINYGTACFSVHDIKSRNNPALDIIFADYSNVEIIGNIYDNPELLKGGVEND